VELAPIRSAAHIVRVIAEELNFPLSTQEEPEIQLLGYLRNKQILLVLDNFEHLLGGAGVVGRILQAAPGVKILVTSREKLSLQGETALGVGGMSFLEEGQFGDLLDQDAVQLFVQASRRRRPDFDPSEEDLELAARICRLVQGMPLAIELAATWMDTLSLQGIAAELSQSLDILKSEIRDLPARHRSIRAAFDHSWSLIDETERELFMRLSIFRGGFTRAAARQAAGASLELLARLVGKSLVRHDPKRDRFEVHELMRQYGQERLEKDPTVEISAHEAHAAYYAQFMHRRLENLKDRRQITALAEIEADIENVRTAWQHSLRRKDISLIQQFIHSLRLVYAVRGWNFEGAELFREAVAAIGRENKEDEAQAVKAMALAYQAYFLAWLGLADKGIVLSREGADILRRLNLREELALALDGLTLCARYLGLFAEQDQAAHELQEIAKDLDDPWLESFSLFLIGTLAIERGDYLKAAESAARSLAISQERGDLIVSIYARSVLGTAALNLGDTEAARIHFLRFLSASEKVGYRWAIENASKYLGQVALATHEIEAAEAYFLKSLRIAEEIGLGRDRINLLYELARVRAAQDRNTRAVEWLACVLEHPTSNQSRFGRGSIQDSAQKLLDRIAETLPVDEFDAAIQRGRSLDFDQVAEELLGPE
jgi:predicted ATPase